MTENKSKRFGYCALVGRPNVGKSTLFNALLGHSLSVVTRKAQTTQSRVMGIVTEDQAQYVLLDTPGVQQKFVKRRFQSLNRIANQAAFEADVAIFVTGGLSWHEDDSRALSALKDFNGPCYCVVNKWDQFAQKTDKQTAFIQMLQDKGCFTNIILASAKEDLSVNVIHEMIIDALPEGDKQYDEHMLTEHSEAFVLSEILRAQCLSFLHEEIPYHCVTEIESLEDCGTHWHVQAVIWVPTSAKKMVIIGKQGKKLESIGQAARLEMEAFMEKKVVLKTWIKVGTPKTD